MTRDYMMHESARLRDLGEIPTWRFDPALKEAAE
jgi:cyclopropane-fatty-acyl-phospholipid synthase